VFGAFVFTGVALEKVDSGANSSTIDAVGESLRLYPKKLE